MNPNEDKENVIPVDFSNAESKPEMEPVEPQAQEEAPTPPVYVPEDLELPPFELKVMGYVLKAGSYKFEATEEKAPPALDVIVAKWNDKTDEERESLFKALESFFKDFHYNCSAGRSTPVMPPELAALDGRFLGFLHSCIPQNWSYSLFKAGFETRPEEERKALLAEAEALQTELKYAHLPTGGATVKRPSGSSGHVPYDELKRMVDQGMLPPNPELTGQTIGIMSRPTGIIPAR